MRGYKGRDTKLKPDIDHVVPLSGGGKHHPDNLRCCCGRCNLAKGGKSFARTIRISTCGDIDFDQLEPPPSLDELVSAWRQWVLPTIDDSIEVWQYTDPSRVERWTEIYRKRIAEREAFMSVEPDNIRRAEEASMAYMGFADFLAKYDERIEALSLLRKRLAICVRCVVAKFEFSQHFVASCLFDMCRTGADKAAELANLSDTLAPHEIDGITGRLRWIEQVAPRRAVATRAVL